MKVIHDAIRYPVTTTVGVLLLVLFGMLALFRIPIQLTPDVEEPKITVQTIWPGASPQEVEREIVDEQEEQLKSLEGLVKMESSSSDSSGSITLTFQVGSDIDSALLKVSNRLEQVPRYPDDVDKPVIRTVDIGAGAIAWLILAPMDEGGFEGDLSTLFSFADDNIKPRFERVPGIAFSNIFGGREREMHVIVDPAKLAMRRVTLNQLGAALDRENRNYSGGDFNEGKRRYIVRTVGEYESTEDIEDIVIAIRNGVPIYLKDVARAELGYRKAGAKVFQKGRLVLAINAVKEPGSNILEVMDNLKAEVARINLELLAPRGLILSNCLLRAA
jgi:HAE1 family hydrophobic/amphiphilic exporter-1